MWLKLPVIIMDGCSITKISLAVSDYFHSNFTRECQPS